MSSQRRIEASRANGAKSHGPTTAAGRSRCAMAAITHGLTAKRVVLAKESKEDFQALREMYFAHFQPRGNYESDLVEQLVAARWRLDRAWALETALLDVETARRQPKIEEEFESCDTETCTALAFRALCDESRGLSGIGRYESRYRRICDRITKWLEARRTTQKMSQGPIPINERPQPAPIAPPPELPES